MEVEKFSIWYKIQSYLNIANHLMNASAAFYMTLYSMRQGWQSVTWHIFLTTVGYQLLMTEAIMVLYSPNSWSYFHSYRTKKHLHWILQTIGTIFIVVGNVIIVVIKKTPHFVSAHAVTGEFWVSTTLKQVLPSWDFRLDFDGFAGIFRSSRNFYIFFPWLEEVHETRID